MVGTSGLEATTCPIIPLRGLFTSKALLPALDLRPGRHREPLAAGLGETP